MSYFLNSAPNVLLFNIYIVFEIGGGVRESTADVF